jgi:hypothetical protein
MTDDARPARARRLGRVLAEVAGGIVDALLLVLPALVCAALAAGAVAATGWAWWLAFVAFGGDPPAMLPASTVLVPVAAALLAARGSGASALGAALVGAVGALGLGLLAALGPAARAVMVVGTLAGVVVWFIGQNREANE